MLTSVNITGFINRFWEIASNLMASFIIPFCENAEFIG
jgi:hypothetical protein